MSLVASSPLRRNRRRVATSAVPGPLWVVIGGLALLFSLLPARWVAQETAVDWIYGLPLPVMFWTTPTKGATTFHLWPTWGAQWAVNAVVWLFLLYLVAKLTALLHRRYDARVRVNRVFLGVVFGAGICALQMLRIPEWSLATVILQTSQLGWFHFGGPDAARSLAVKLLLIPVVPGLALLANGLRAPWRPTGVLLAMGSFALGLYAAFYAS